MPDSADTPDPVVLPSSGPPLRFKIATTGTLYSHIDTCWHAQTLEAFSPQFGCTVWIPLPCKQWSCRYCAQAKIKRLSIKTESAKPNRLLTLTVDPSQYNNPRHAFDETRRKVPECMRHLRTRFKTVEYLRVTELTKRGWPHYHLMVRSPYIPHAVCKKIWNQLTGALIVDLRQIEDKFNTYTYLVKYLSKMHKIGWTERHVSYSRSFFPEENYPARDSIQLEDRVIVESHPATYLYARFRGAHLTRLGYNLYGLDPTGKSVDDLTQPDEWTQCAEPPAPDKLFPPTPQVVSKPHPALFPKQHEVHDA